jgi:kumamolisin
MPLPRFRSYAEPKSAHPNFYRPEDLAHLYNFPTTYKTAAGQTRKLDGTGQKIGIIQLGGSYLQTDLLAFFGTKPVPNFVPYLYNVQTNQFARGRPVFVPGDGANGENALDMQIIGALVPKATINIYFGYDVLTGEQYFYEAIQQAVQDNCSVISISWGLTENITYLPFFTRLNNLLQTATTGPKKITILAAAGDDGSSDDASGRACTDFPGSSPYVLSCGGTKLLADRNKKTIVRESVWNNKNGSATGGGVSQLFGKPVWQQQITQFTMRGLPDVAGHADPLHSPYYIFNEGQVMGMGGTSAVAPLYASLALLLRQARGSNLGLLQPLVYSQRKQVCRDITLGDNDTTPNGLMDFAAAKDWDACSGCGALNGQALFNVMFPKSKDNKEPIKKKAAPTPKKTAPAPKKTAPMPKKTANILAVNKFFSEKWKK